MLPFTKALCSVLLSIGLTTSLTAQTLTLQPTKLTVPSKYAPFYQSRANLAVPDSVRLPQGFRINVFHAGMQKPRFFAWSPAGVLHVTDMGAEAVFALPDRNNDGIADTAIVVAAPLKEAHSLVFVKGAMLVAEPTRVLRFLDRDGDGIYETGSTLIDSIPNGGVFNHYTRTLVADTARGYLYLSVGASCDACREQNPERAAILRFNNDGSGRTLFATGLRNAIGMTIEPVSGQLWATNADRNGLGEDKPEEIITTVPQSSFHGFPIAFTSSTSNGALRSEWANLQASPDYRAMLPTTRMDSQRVASLKIAEATLTARSTPMGIAFYTGNVLPPLYRNAALVAVHGSFSAASRRVAAGYNVVLMRHSAVSGRYIIQDFLNGFLTDSLAYSHWGRPCGVGVSPGGDVYVSSDAAIGAIYRISYTSEAISAQPNQDFPSMIAPNPASGGSWIDFIAPAQGTMRLRIADVRGAVVAEYSTSVQQGRGAISLAEALATASNVSAGAY
jgi:glucose/arabinose dehydrogenase